MATIGLVLFIIGGVIALVGGLWMLVEIFSTGLLWGIGSLLFSPISLIWLITHWQQGKYPFLVQMTGIVIMVPGMLMTGEIS